MFILLAFQTFSGMTSFVIKVNLFENVLVSAGYKKKKKQQMKIISFIFSCNKHCLMKVISIINDDKKGKIIALLKMSVTDEFCCFNLND